MASPEATDPSGTLDSGFHEVLSAPEGWKKELMQKKGGTPKKKDVVYIAPDGEEIRTKRQVEKYLKNHPGGPSVADFDFSTGETPRRSARLSSKGRLSSDSMEVEPAPKRSKAEQEEALVVVSPRKPSKRKSGPQAVVTADKDEVMEDVEKAEEGDNTVATADGTVGSADAKPVEEKVAASSNETEENTEDGKQGEEVIVVTTGEVKVAESAEQVPAAIEEMTSVGANPAEKVNAEEQVPKIEETLIVTDTVIGEAPTVVGEEMILEAPAVEEVVRPSEGETSVKEEQEVKTVVNEDIVYVPTTEKVDGKDDDPLKPKELTESQGIHALIDEPVTKSPEQQTTTEPSLPAAERELRGCGKTRGSRKLQEISSIPIKYSPGIGCSVGRVAQGFWDPTDSSHLLAVKTALHLSAVPDTILCRDSEQSNVIKFCKACITEERAGSIYICGCPGTGKSLTIEKVKLLCATWSKEADTLQPKMVAINCTSLTDPKHIYLRVLQALRPSHDSEDSNKNNDLVMKELRQLICNSTASNARSSKQMLLLTVDEMDYLITRDQLVLYELFRLTTFSNSRLVLIGIANAIDLTDRLLPKLRSMNCKVDVITFPTYSKDQILAVLQQRLLGLPYPVFHLAALELCARKVAAATGDMRKALHVCRSAVELVEAEAHAARLEAGCEMPMEFNSSNKERRGGGTATLNTRENLENKPSLVRIDTMAKALSRIFRSPVVETIQALPRHQQMVLCAVVRRFRGGKKDSNLGELNTGYLGFCKSAGMQPLAAPEFSSVCQVLADQALLSLGVSREDRLRRVTLKVDEEDVIFALQGVRFFRTCLQ